MRETSNSEKYFTDRIEFNNAAIRVFEAEILKRVEEGSRESGKGSPGVAQFALAVIKSMYSRGDSVVEISSVADLYIFNQLDTWKPNSGLQSLIDALSLMVLFGGSDTHINLVKRVVSYNSVDLFLVHVFLNYLDKSWAINSEYMYDHGYKETSKLISEPDCKKREALLIKYISDWYHASRDSAWHDSHLRENNSYVGYWSLEAAALSKVLEIDDESLKETQFYPYDLVHFRLK